MLMKIGIVWIAVVGLLWPSLSSADVRLPKLIGDNMVLQRDAKLELWGWADPGEKIVIDFRGQTLKARTDKTGRWSIYSGPFSAGGPYDLIVSGRNRIELRNVLIGDVWLASGQSNMEFTLGRGPEVYMLGVVNADQEIADTAYPQLRLFKVDHKMGFKPACDVEAGTWVASTPQTAADFSAVAYLFGRAVHKRYHIPVGLIETSWGGTVAEAWMSTAGLKAFPEFGKDIDELQQANDAKVRAEHDQYVKLKTEWDKQHSAEDRGERDGRPIWADPALDASSWPTIIEPQSKPNELLKGFDGVVWFRREITVPANLTGRDVRVQLSSAGKTDTTYFNGKEIGHTEGWDKPRSYFVPAGNIKSGRNVIVIRMTGEDGYVGMFDSDNPDKSYVDVGGTSLPLSGSWAYQPGTDVENYPVEPALSKLIDSPNKAALLFNGMIHPLLSFRIKGAIWYQGESNADRSAQYRTLFPSLIRDWRAQWGYEFPFLFVQLAGLGRNKPDPAEYPWAELREAQSMALSLPNTGMATAIDVGDENDIHPRNKQDVAHRLMLAAAKVAYGENNIVYDGPTYKSMQIEGSRVRIKLSTLGSGFVVKNKYDYIQGFEIAAADGKFRWAQALQDGQDIVVFNHAISQPVAVRYDWMNTPDGNLFNTEGLPALPFRTDAPHY
jgi:sialate O-acetylesterase